MLPVPRILLQNPFECQHQSERENVCSNSRISLVFIKLVDGFSAAIQNSSHPTNFDTFQKQYEIHICTFQLLWHRKLSVWDVLYCEWKARHEFIIETIQRNITFNKTQWNPWRFLRPRFRNKMTSFFSLLLYKRMDGEERAILIIHRHDKIESDDGMQIGQLPVALTVCRVPFSRRIITF